MSSELKTSKTKEVKAALGPGAFLVKRGRKNLAAVVPLEGGGYRVFVLRHVESGFKGMPYDDRSADKPEDLFDTISKFYQDQS